jgi:tRNA (Thr-GGU) A37 N-methylase
MISLKEDETEEFLDAVDSCDNIEHINGVAYFHKHTRAIITVDRRVYERRNGNNS